MRGIAAFEAAEANVIKSLPGFEVDRTLMKEDFKKISFEKQGTMRHGDILSKKPLTQGFSPLTVGNKYQTILNPILGSDDKKILPEYS